MGEVKQYECPKCGYTTPVLHFGCGFRDYYEVYICKACQTIQSSLVATEDCMSEFDEESELDNVNLVTVYGEDYNNKELVEYSKREKAKKCNHYSSQVISEIPYQIEIDFQNLTDIDKRLPHMKYYLTFKDIVKMVRKGKKLNVTVKNPNGSEHGVKSVTVNGEKIEGKLILDSILKAENDIVIEL